MELPWVLLETSHYLLQWTTRDRNKLVLPRRAWGAKKKRKAITFFQKPFVTHGLHRKTCLQLMLLVSKSTAQSYRTLSANTTRFTNVPLFLPFSIKIVLIWGRGREERRTTTQCPRTAEGTEWCPWVEDLGTCGRLSKLHCSRDRSETWKSKAIIFMTCRLSPVWWNGKHPKGIVSFKTNILAESPVFEMLLNEFLSPQ